MKRKFKIALWVFLGFIIIMAIMFLWAVIDPIRYKNITINDVRLANLADGEYEGTFKGGRFSNTVVVTIMNQKIVNIKKTKPLSTSTDDLYKQIYNEVIKKQSLNIDTISGASVTTKTALKAIENALLK